MNKGKLNIKGFTLIELLVSILIIGILAAIALPQYQKAKYKAKYAAIMPIVKAVGEAMERYYIVHFTYPVKISEIDVSLESTNIQEDEGHDVILFDWGFCYLGWVNQFVCDLEKEKIAFAYYPEIRKYRCYAMDINPTSRAYKFCESLPNAVRLTGGIGTCRWNNKTNLSCIAWNFIIK